MSTEEPGDQGEKAQSPPIKDGGGFRVKLTKAWEEAALIVNHILAEAVAGLTIFVILSVVGYLVGLTAFGKREWFSDYPFKFTTLEVFEYGDLAVAFMFVVACVIKAGKEMFRERH